MEDQDKSHVCIGQYNNNCTRFLIGERKTDNAPGNSCDLDIKNVTP